MKKIKVNFFITDPEKLDLERMGGVSGGVGGRSLNSASFII